MRRRAFLTAGGSLFLSGCSGIGGSSRPATPAFDSRFAGAPCQATFGDRTTCYHTVSDPDNALFLEPDREVLPSAGAAPLEFTLHNNLNQGVEAVVTFPAVLRRVEGVWYHIPQRRQDSGGVDPLAPGETSRWALLRRHRRTRVDGVDWQFAKPFGAGEFAYRVRTTSPRKDALARFQVDGDPLDLSPPGTVETRQDGTTLIARHERIRTSEISVAVTIAEAVDSDPGVVLPPEVFHGKWELRCVGYLDRPDVSTIIVRTERNYFRTPVEWLKAAGAWDGADTVYRVGSRTFTIEQSSVSPEDTVQDR